MLEQCSFSWTRLHPRTASFFNPILKPVLERGIDEIAVEGEVFEGC